MPELINFSCELKQVVKIAQALAKEYMQTEFAPEHLLKALLHKDSGLQPLLETLDQDIFYLEEWAEVRIESLNKTIGYSELIPGSTSISEVINEAENIRLKLTQEFLDPVHVLAAICTPGVAFTYEQMKSFPLKREDLINQLAANDEIQSALGSITQSNTFKEKKSSHALLKYCRDKSQLAIEGKLDPIVGRDNEVRMMAEILCRRSKPNVLLVGEPGVGKSALADGFALAILAQKVPKQLHHARIFELDMGSLVAGASYKGEVEERLKGILEEIKRYDKAILFIDEMHSLLDKQGSAIGSANLLKPELARGEITVIGATTLEEYRKYMEPDEAFCRRFELLEVKEPSEATCFHMLKEILPYYEKHHLISVPDNSIREAIRYAKRYIKERRLPDAAIDLLDRTMAALQMIEDSGSKGVLETTEKYIQWCKDDEINPTHSLEEWKWFYHQLNQDISPILWSYIQSEDDPAKMVQVEDIKKHLQVVLEVLKNAALQNHSCLENKDLAAIVSHKTGIPLGKIQSQERERLLNMEEVIKQRVVGQDHAIKSICDAVLESRAGLSKPGQPIGSFFLLGPTGTGKTELTKSLAEFLFQDETFMIRFDMSEFKEEHAAALLYGAPPGYVGYEEGGLLVNKIRQKPYSVVLFDEIEKAHASVFDVFLQIMDEGKLHDKLGKEGDFSNALIIFTSNIGSSYVSDAFNQGEIPSSQKLLETMGQHFRPEFLGRLTEIVPFAPMNEEMVKNILKIQLKSLYQILEKQGIHLNITDKAFEQLAKSGFTPAYGARPLAGVVRSEIRRPLSKKIIIGEIKSGDTITLSSEGEGGFHWEISKMLQEEIHK